MIIIGYLRSVDIIRVRAAGTSSLTGTVEIGFARRVKFYVAQYCG